VTPGEYSGEVLMWACVWWLYLVWCSMVEPRFAWSCSASILLGASRRQGEECRAAVANIVTNIIIDGIYYNLVRITKFVTSLAIIACNI